MPRLKFKFLKKKLRATFDFDIKLARRMADPSYYQAQAKNIKDWEHIEREKVRLATPRHEKITELLEFYTQQGLKAESSIARILRGIYNKNRSAARSGSVAQNDNLLPLVASPEILLLAYRAIRGNKGALTQGAEVSRNSYMAMDPQQRAAYLKSFSLPDGMSLHAIYQISSLIRAGRYPWGSSSRVYFDKPGNKLKKRPITIPSFTDRLVQKAIEIVLQAIYEPSFEKLNRSFGFRPNKGTHDALIAILSRNTNGMRTAVEGDVEAAYDTVDKKVLLEILSKRIRDKKLLKLIESRLDYDYVEKETGLRVRPELGIPQGGIDSPYLFNIYMSELDEYVHTDLKDWLNGLNGRLSKQPTNRRRSSLYAKEKKERRALKRLKEGLKSLPVNRTTRRVERYRKRLFSKIRDIRLVNHQQRRVSTSGTESRKLRLFYVRYADDWILLTNGSKEVGMELKEAVSEFLQNKLKLKLSESKTLVTDITKVPARFLGFEIRANTRGALRKLKLNKKGSIKKANTAKKSGLLLWAAPDRTRLLNRSYMRGLCNRVGFPKEVPWLSCLESFAIVDRFNACMRGLAEFYLPIVRNRSSIHRWIYILRFACLKTLAQKYRCSINKIFNRFGHNMYSRSTQTVRIRVEQKFGEEVYYKDWTLFTYKDLVESLVKFKDRRATLLGTFLDRENGTIGEYPLKEGSLPKVTNDNFVEALTWVKWRTAASINMPCAYCGSFENTEMHHIRHVRKRAYALIPQDMTYQQVMALRNRKQIPLCATCHQQRVHAGKYDGPALIKLAPSLKLIDNRVVHVESFVKPGKEYVGKTLIEKGWKEKTAQLLS